MNKIIEIKERFRKRNNKSIDKSKNQWYNIDARFNSEDVIFRTAKKGEDDNGKRKVYAINTATGEVSGLGNKIKTIKNFKTRKSESNSGDTPKTTEPKKTKRTAEEVKEASKEATRKLLNQGTAHQVGEMGDTVNEFPVGTKIEGLNGEVFTKTGFASWQKGYYSYPTQALLDTINSGYVKVNKVEYPEEDVKAESQFVKGLETTTGIRKVPATKADPISSENAIKKLAKMDPTTGSCVSQALAYCANLGGYSVKDYRGGKSRAAIGLQSNTRELYTRYGEVKYGKNDIELAKEMLSRMEDGKEYLFSAGQHCSIVRKNGSEYEYLELQGAGDIGSGSRIANGWTKFKDNTLTWRFGCKESRGRVVSCGFAEVDAIKSCEELEQVIQYFNTEKQEKKSRKK